MNRNFGLTKGQEEQRKMQHIPYTKNALLTAFSDKLSDLFSDNMPRLSAP